MQDFARDKNLAEKWSDKQYSSSAKVETKAGTKRGSVGDCPPSAG